MIKKILSYLYPIVLHKESSTTSTLLEVTLYNGKLLLDSKHTNYSYGALEQVLKKGLLYIGKTSIQEMNAILILGVAGGSVVKTLVNDFGFTKRIKGVEIDENCNKIANDYFGLNQLKNFTCIIDDAENFVQNTTEKFDLLIIDIFNDDKMPKFLFEKSFVENCQKLVTINGYILFNTMLPRNQKELLNHYKLYFSENKYTITHLKNVKKYNDLLLIRKYS